VKEAAGTTVLVTGATDGLGRRVAWEPAAKGAAVLPHGRSQVRLRAVLEEVCAQTGGERARSYLVNLSSLAAVRELRP
jgi:short-subunit dehydrogenase